MTFLQFIQKWEFEISNARRKEFHRDIIDTIKNEAKKLKESEGGPTNSTKLSS